MKLPLLLVLLLLPVCAEEKSLKEEVLARVAERSASIRDFQAAFEQRSVREGLSKPVLSSGTLRYRVDPQSGPVVLQKAEKPEPTLIRVARGRMETYVPADATLEIIDLKEGEAGSRAVDATVLLFGKPRSFWDEQYEVALAPKADAKDPDELILVPRDAGLRKTLPEIRLWVDAKTSLPVRVRYTYARGEEVTLSFSDLKVNQGLKAEDLALEVPKGTEILHPSDTEEKP